MAWDAFLSYSSRDRKAVARIHRLLERYRPPRSAKVDKRQLQIFRYEEDQRVAHSLVEDLERRVRQVDYLILAASVHAAASEKVALELSAFTTARGIEKLLPVVIADSIEQGVPESIKPMLRDPIWTDGRAATLPWLKWFLWGRRRCRREMLPLLAYLLGGEPDDLVARERTRRLIQRAALATLPLMMAAGLLALVLRTPAEAWMPTDAQRIARSLDEASLISHDGYQSLRVFTRWTERISDDAQGRALLMELDLTGRQTGVVGEITWEDNRGFDMKHPLGALGTLASEVKRLEQAPHPEETPPDSIETLLGRPQPAAGSMSDALKAQVTPKAAALGLLNPASLFSHCFSVAKDDAICFIDFEKGNAVLPVRDLGSSVRIGIPIRDADAPQAVFFAVNQGRYYATMSFGDDESGYTKYLLRSRDGLRWQRIPFAPGNARDMQFTGLATASGKPETIAVAMSSVAFGSSAPPVRTHIYVTNNEGLSWRELEAGIPQAPSSSFAGVTADGRVATLFADGSGRSLAIWRPLTIRERIIGQYGIRK